MPELTAIAGLGSPHYPCDRCRDEWTDDTPPDPADRSTWTPTLLAFVEPFGTPEPLPAPSRGLGDVVAATLRDWGIRKRKGCGCDRRQEFLNRLVPHV